MTVVPTQMQIRAQVSAVLRKVPDACVIGIRAPLTVETGDSLRLGDRELAITRSDSVLEIRERLTAEGCAACVVLLTPLDEAELGADLVGRLADRRLFAIDPWQLVKDRFHARFVDPRLAEQHPWVARVLLEAEPADGFPPAPSGFLQADLVWCFLFKALLDQGSDTRDAEAWVEWSLDPRRRALAAELTPEVLAGLSLAVERGAGEVAQLVFQCATGEEGARTLAIGLLARVLFGEGADGDSVATKASGKLEALIGRASLEAKPALGWADASESVAARWLARRPASEIAPLLKEADQLLAQLGAGGLAYRSRYLYLGFEQRLERFAQAVDTAREAKTPGALAALEAALDSVEDHALAAHESARIEGAAMAMRLARWLGNHQAHPPQPAASLAEAAMRYRQDGGHVDWARARLWEGDVSTTVGKAYGALWTSTSAIREAENRRFGALLANWSQTGSHDSTLIRVEHVIEAVVAPLATAAPILLVVIDGMGMAVFRELQADLTRRGWSEIDTPEDSRRRPVIAALPTVTGVSRTSLLCGSLSVGTANDEKAGFAAHPALVGLGARSKPPVLFHKGDLAGQGSVVAPKVVTTIADDKQRVVGVVINAVDDHLAKGDQIRVDWTVRRIKPLEELLSAASDAGRAVVLVSDHGHIPEHSTVGRGETVAERWRDAVGEPEDDEVELTGPRVALGNGNKIIAPWSERVRYSAKKNGYHGGASPQEVIIPLGVFVPAGLEVSGWQEVATEVPAWWDQDVAPPVPAVKPPPVSVKPRPPSRPGEQGRLFPTEEEIAAAPASPPTDWIDRLLASEQMARQRQMAARVALPEDKIRAILAALEERGDKLTRTALAKRINAPPTRLGGMLSALRRLLNVEGYAVLSVDEESDTVELNRKQLFTQFGL